MADRPNDAGNRRSGTGNVCRFPDESTFFILRSAKFVVCKLISSGLKPKRFISSCSFASAIAARMNTAPVENSLSPLSLIIIFCGSFRSSSVTGNSLRKSAPDGRR